MDGKTPLSSRLEILADLWLNYRDDEEFKDFIEYNDLGLPLAYMLANNIVQPTSVAENFINESFNLLLASMDIEEDTGFDSLESLFGEELF